MFPLPSEFSIGGIYLPPILVSSFLGLVAARLTTRWLARRRLGRYVAHPPLAFLAMTVIYTVVIGSVVIGF